MEDGSVEYSESDSISKKLNVIVLRTGIEALFLKDISGTNLKYLPQEKEDSEDIEKAVPGPSQKQIYYFHPDHLGSATYLSDANGKPYQFFLNLPFGETMAEQRSGSFENQYKFNGKELDAETGNYYYGARYYDPRISVWLSVDPLAEKAPGWTPYRYGFNNPIKYTDPKGLFETKFGAWWHRTWNGGGDSKIKYDNRRKEYYYNRGDESKGNEVNFTAVYSNSKRSAGTLVFQVEGKATLGVQAGFRTPFGTAEAGIMTGDIGKVGWSSREKSNNGFYAKYGDGKGHN